MHRLTAAALLALLLAGCAAKAPPAPEPVRDTGRQIYSTAAYDAKRLTGAWVQVADVSRDQDCGPGRLSVEGAGSGLVVDWQLCLNGVLRTGSGPLQPQGNGRFAVPGSDLSWWVLWADADGRTLVLGTPSGAFGIVLDRGKIPPDRAKAAADILAWNGYDVSLLDWR